MIPRDINNDRKTNSHIHHRCHWLSILFSFQTPTPIWDIYKIMVFNSRSRWLVGIWCRKPTEGRHAISESATFEYLNAFVEKHTTLEIE